MTATPSVAGLDEVPRRFGLPPSEPDFYKGPIQKPEKWLVRLVFVWLGIAALGSLISVLSPDPLIAAIFAPPGPVFFTRAVSMIFFTWVFMYVLGWLVEKHGLNVAYSRKFGHIVGSLVFPLLAVPAVLPLDELYHAWYQSIVWRSLFSFLIPYALLVQPIRSRFRPFYICMRALDRPEDRPYTLLWFCLQMLAISVVMLPMTQYYVHVGMWSLFLIPALAVGLGDGLAEPVGKLFGKKKYEVGALFTQQRYVRTYVGSACVAFFTVVGVLVNAPVLSNAQFWFLMFTLPPVITLIEARSPHTWDNFFMYVGCGVFIYLALLI